jgi:hypothetical protein
MNFRRVGEILLTVLERLATPADGEAEALLEVRGRHDRKI